MQRAQACFTGENVRTAVAAVVSERAGDCVVNRSVGVVLHFKSEQSGRHRRIPFIVRDERAEGRHADLARKGVAMERDLGYRETTDESRIVEMRRASHCVAIGPKADPVNLPPARGAGGQAFIRTVEYACVDELPAAL